MTPVTPPTVGYSLLQEDISNAVSSLVINETARATCFLRSLPAEVREMIFKPSLVEAWEGKIPELIAACRTDNILYKEVLSIFAKNQVFELKEGNNWCF